MASSIAAITTGSGGIVSTGDSSGNLNLVSGTTTIVAVTSAGVSVTGTLTASGTTTLVTPVLGTPASGNLANCTGAVVASLSTASGSAPSYSARAWVSFNGTGTPAIRGSANVSSITDNAQGDFTVNMTTAQSDGNYSIAAMGSTDTGAGAAVCTLKEANQGGINPTTTAFRLSVRQLSGADFDTQFVLATVFR